MFGRTKVKKQSKSLKRKLIIWAITIAVTVGVVLYIVHLLNRPVTGVVKQLEPVVSEKQESSADKTLESKYFTLQYPGRYELQPDNNNTASLDSWILIARLALGFGQASKIAISVASVNAGGVTEDSAYKHAEAFPEIYEISTSVYSAEPVILLERSSPSYELTALWPHGAYLLSISLTSAEKTEELTKEVDAYLRSVAWR